MVQGTGAYESSLCPRRPEWLSPQVNRGPGRAGRMAAIGAEKEAALVASFSSSTVTVNNLCKLIARQIYVDLSTLQAMQHSTPRCRGVVEVGKKLRLWSSTRASMRGWRLVACDCAAQTLKGEVRGGGSRRQQRQQLSSRPSPHHQEQRRLAPALSQAVTAAVAVTPHHSRGYWTSLVGKQTSI